MKKHNSNPLPNKISSLAFAVGTVLALSSLHASAIDYKEIQVNNPGTVSGSVSFSGKDEEPVIYTVTKDNEACGSEPREIDFIKVNPDGTLQDVVVFLDQVKEGKSFAPVDATMNHVQCAFDPFVSVMTKHGKLTSDNIDPVLHNLHTYELFKRGNKQMRKTAFNLSQPPGKKLAQSVKLKRGEGMKVECDAHDFMHGFVFVAENPYYALVDEKGAFKIENVPAGTYTLKAWHGTLGVLEQSVTIDADGQISTTFNYE